MTLQQLRYFREVVRRDLNISKAAAALHVTQPGLSRQLRTEAWTMGCGAVAAGLVLWLLCAGLASTLARLQRIEATLQLGPGRAARQEFTKE